MDLEISSAAMDVALFCRLNVSRKFNVPIRFSELSILILIATSKNSFCSADISEFFGVSKPTTSANVKSLIKNGYVECIPSQKDRRSYSLKATPLGLRIAEDAFAEHTAEIEALSKAMGKDNFDQLIRMIQMANRIMKKRSGK